jgi:hypothetical protein
MATNRVSPKKGKVVDIPDAVVTIGTPTAGDASVSVAFTASSPATGGPVQKYTAISSPGSISASASTSPVVVTGLTNGTAYTFTVAAANATGNGVFSSASASATPVVSGSYESIATFTLGSNTQAVTFSSIPSTYKDIEIRYISRDTYTNSYPGLQILFNGAGWQARHLLGGDGAGGATGSSGSYGGSQGYLGASIGNNLDANNYATGVLRVVDYANTNKNKTFMNQTAGMGNSTSGYAYLYSGFMNTTTAISSVTFQEGDTNFKLMPGSTFALYGIKG